MVMKVSSVFGQYNGGKKFVLELDNGDGLIEFKITNLLFP